MYRRFGLLGNRPVNPWEFSPVNLQTHAEFVKNPKSAITNAKLFNSIVLVELG